VIKGTLRVLLYATDCCSYVLTNTSYTTVHVHTVLLLCSYMSNAGYRVPSGRWLATPSEPLQPLHAGGAGIDHYYYKILNRYDYTMFCSNSRSLS
jgi:hypothetical protein